MERDRSDALRRDAGSSAPAGPAPATRVARREWKTYDEVAEAIGDAALKAFIHSRQVRPWSLDARSAGSALLQRAVEGAAVSSTGVVAPGRVAFFLTGEKSASRRCNGEELDDRGAFRWVPGEELSSLSRRPSEWVALTATTDAIRRAERILEGEPSAARPLDARASKAAPATVAGFRGLLLDAMRAIDEAGPAGLHPESARNLEETLGLAAARLFAGLGPLPRPRRGVDRGRVLAEVEAFLASAGPEPVYVSALSERLGLPERTLRYVFEEQFGASPMRVLRARRLCEARSALRSAPAGTRVSKVAGRFGFWHLGQFATDYRKLFGERPSEALLASRARSRPRGEGDGRDLTAWAATSARFG